MNKEKTGSFYTVIICMGLIMLILGTFFYVALGQGKPKRQQEISVILYSAGNGAWESLQEGLKRAEDDFMININYVTFRENADAEEQMEIIEREIMNGAEGVIIAVDEYESFSSLWEEKAFDMPIVAVESGFGMSSVPFISADNYEMGKLLGEEILNDFAGEENISIAIPFENAGKDSVQERKRGICDALEGKAQILLSDKTMNFEEVDAVVALDKEMLQELSEYTDTEMDSVKKYGIGNTASIVAALDQGKIEKIVFQNEFNMGYLAVETLLGEMGSIRSKNRKTIDFYSVSGKDIYNPPYEQLLFPIVQ